MQVCKKIIKRIGIIGCILFSIIGFCGCQSTSSDAGVFNEVQEELSGDGNMDSALADGAAVKEQEDSETENYITPDDVTEDSYLTQNKDNTDNSASANASDASSISDTSSSSLDEEKNSTKISADKQSPSDSQTTEGKAEDTCVSLTIECKDILNNKDKLKKNKRKLIPSNGIIYSNDQTTFSAGETLFDILLRETKNNNIQMEYNYTPGFRSNYIEGIANLYEFDCGENSGWNYLVNGQSLSYGCNQYIVQAGDEIIWRYVCGD